MADTQNKLLKTRIQLKYDTFANWTSNNPKLLAGEIAIATLTTAHAVSPVEGDTQRPVLFKVGDGERNFNALPWASALAADVYSWAKKTEAEFTTWLNTLEFVDMTSFGLEGKGTVASAIQAVGSQVSADMVENLGTETEDITDVNAEIRSYIVAGVNGYDSIKLAHEKKLGTEFTGTTAAAEVNAFGSSASIKVPKLNINEYGHVTSASEVEYKVSLPTPTDYTEAIADAKKAGTDAQADVDALERLVGTLPTDATATDVVGYVVERTSNIASDSRVKAVEDDVALIKGDYLTSTDRTNLTNAIATAKGEAISEAAGDATTKANKALDDAKSYVDGKFTDANLDQYTTEQEVKDIVDKVIVDAVSDDTITGLTNLVEYLAEHGGEYSELAATVGGHTSQIATIEGKPAMAITSTQISNWENEVGAKEIANSKTTTAEVKTQIEAYGYATEADLTLAEGRLDVIEAKPAMAITTDEIGKWNGEIGAKAAAQAAQKTADDYATAHAGDYTNGKIDELVNAVQTNVNNLTNGAVADNTSAIGTINRTLATYGNIVTHNVAEFATAAQGTKADTAVQPGQLATIATTGKVQDLIQDANTYIVFDCGSSSTVI